jgi:hypothetical protein
VGGLKNLAFMAPNRSELWVDAAGRREVPSSSE